MRRAGRYRPGIFAACLTIFSNQLFIGLLRLRTGISFPHDCNGIQRLRQFRQFIGRKRVIIRREVLLQMRQFGGSGNRDYKRLLRQQPRQRHLGGGKPALVAKVRQRFDHDPVGADRLGLVTGQGGTVVVKNIQNYSFFSYDVNEAVHLSEKERQIVVDCFGKIQYELEHAVDKHSRNLIAANIELFLNYCTRFYDRQFITRDNINKSLLGKFESLLNDYYAAGRQLQEGIPAVAWCAGELNLSANYFGDMIRKETGKTAQEYIQMKVIDIAKERMHDAGRSVSEIAYELGFKYPQHFSRLFKQRVGCTPQQYRAQQ